MNLFAASPPAPVARLRDLVELGKPRLSLLVIFTAAVGLFSATRVPDLATCVVFLLATSSLVAAANTLNCWIEREIDGLMNRTQNRPLPAGRLEPRIALLSGSCVSVIALTTLYLTTNALTTFLGAVALITYVLIYTPLKRVTPWVVLVGAVPGAMPPLMGWVAAEGGLGRPGWFLFAILFCWQLPHFGAVSIYLKEDFRRGGLRVLPLAYGDRAARCLVLVFTLGLVLVSLAAGPLGLAGAAYTATAAALGLVFLALVAPGLQRQVGEGWARWVFAWSLLYLPLLITVLVLDR